MSLVSRFSPCVPYHSLHIYLELACTVSSHRARFLAPVPASSNHQAQSAAACRYSPLGGSRSATDSVVWPSCPPLCREKLCLEPLPLRTPWKLILVISLSPPPPPPSLPAPPLPPPLFPPFGIFLRGHIDPIHVGITVFMLRGRAYGSILEADSSCHTLSVIGI